MMAAEIMAVLMVVAALVAVMGGFPVAFTLAGLGLIFGSLASMMGVFDPAILHGLPARVFGVMGNQLLVAVPLFIFMGMVLERAGLAGELLSSMGRLFGRRGGGLGISVIFVGALLAASTGIVGATVVAMGVLSLPAMLKSGYCPRLSSGTICAAGTLGQIIPPSTVLVFIGDFLQNANQTVQSDIMDQGGDLSLLHAVSVGHLFAGALIPGLLLVAAYSLYLMAMAILRPQRCPPLVDVTQEGLSGRDILHLMTTLLPPILLIIAVLGSILMGIATPTESAAIGALGALILAALRGRFSIRLLHEASEETMSISAMIFFILLGASVFSLVFIGLEGSVLVADILATLPGGKIGALVAVMLVMFVLGFFLDSFEIIFITVPLTAPALIAMGVHPVWLGVLIGLNLQTSFLTPPFGFALFYLRGAAGKLVTTAQIYRGVIPFIGIQAGAMAMLIAFPVLATWLPDRLFPAPGSVPQDNARQQSLEDLLDAQDGDSGLWEEDFGNDSNYLDGYDFP